MDFHRTVNGTITYLRTHYGQEFLEEVCRRTAQDVYRSLHEALQRGDPEPLVAHWHHFLDREHGEYEIQREADVIRLIMHRCPAVAYLEGRGIAIDPAFCQQTVALNAGLAEGTPFEITTEVQGSGRCVQTIRRREP
jgi:hypothetical protein